jgi:hypothetical protein
MTTIREIRQRCDDADEESTSAVESDVTLPVGVVRELVDEFVRFHQIADMCDDWGVGE